MSVNIRGVEISDKSDIEDILSAFTILNSEVENLKNELVNQLTKYNEIANNITDDTEKREEIINAINDLQVKANDILDKYNSFKDSIDKELNSTLSSFSDELKSDIKNALNEIDISTLENTFNSKIENLQSKLDKKLDEINADKESLMSNAMNLENYLLNLQDLQEKTQNDFNNTLKKIDDDISDSLENFNSQVKNINIKAIIITAIVALFVGTAIGSLTTSYFNNLNKQTVPAELVKQLLQQKQQIKQLKQQLLDGYRHQ